MLQQRGYFAAVEAALLDYTVDFHRTPDPAGGDRDCCDPAHSHIDYLNPGAGLGYAAASGRWAVALAAFGPYAGAVEYDRDSDARYLIVDQANGLAYAQLSGALRLLDGLSVGVGLQLRFFRMWQQFVGSVYPGLAGMPEDRQFDALLDVRVDDWFSPGFVAGVIWAPLRQLQVGFSYQNGFDVEGLGTLHVQIPSHYMYAEVGQEGERLRLQTRLPDIFRFGLRYLPSARLDLEASLVWERWSQHTYITGIPDEPISFVGVVALGEYQMQRITIEDSFQDTLSFRLGGELRLLDGVLRLRAGAFLENGAVPDETLNPGALDSDKLGIGGGATLLAGGLEWDLGLLHLFMVDRQVTSSRKRQVNPLYPAGSEVPSVVGNGSYSSRLDVLALGVARRW
ncbi:MAG: hypothetical protein FJ125_16830 [Deltaproteobacteria bacterium]|nr:hypothetical protein [Deltaproteobacteria bacterium]